MCDMYLIQYTEVGTRAQGGRVMCPGFQLVSRQRGFPGGSVLRNLPANAGDVGLIPGSGRSSGAGNGNPFWNSCLGNAMDRGAWWVVVHEVAKSQNDLATITTGGRENSDLGL